ncbi:MAG: hypothetical protein PWQ20_617 [Thermotogaceae bacterium]|nr:hypothetical protein [Thermotogaceae bacterium]MDN5337547.1 hypothetical protein [Thermotogaceae bacterium]
MARRSVFVNTINLINLIIGILNCLFLILIFKSLSFFVFVVIINLLIFLIVNRDVGLLLIAVLTYPIGLMNLLKGSEQSFPDIFEVEPKDFMNQPETVDIDVLPLKSYLIAGTQSEKKVLVQLIVERIKQKIDVENMFVLLRKLINDPHPDVGLYASEVIEELENYYIRKMTENFDNPEVFCEAALDYIKAGFAYGELLNYYKKAVLEKLESIEGSEKYYLLKYRLLEDKEILYEGFEKTNSIQIIDELIKIELKERNFAKLKELLELRKTLNT